MPNQITGSTIKWVAIMTMVIDHTAAVALAGTFPPELWWMRLLRLVGRIAFPLFSFLLVEGFLHTRSVKRYAARLAVFAVLSEIPFNLALRGEIFFPAWNNIFFTLLLSLALLWCLEHWEDRPAQVLALLAAGLLADFLRCDYGAAGVLTVAVLYLARGSRWAFPGAVAVLALVSGDLTELAALAAAPLVWRYSGDPGRRGGKYFFYAFYPLHLLVLTAVRMGMLG